MRALIAGASGGDRASAGSPPESESARGIRPDPIAGLRSRVDGNRRRASHRHRRRKAVASGGVADGGSRVLQEHLRHLTSAKDRRFERQAPTPSTTRRGSGATSRPLTPFIYPGITQELVPARGQAGGALKRVLLEDHGECSYHVDSEGETTGTHLAQEGISQLRAHASPRPVWKELFPSV
jgi:hypothetical protein